MALVTYDARRSLAAGHAVDETYSLRLQLTPATERSVQDLKNAQQSLNGKSEIQYFGQVETWSIQLAPANLHDAELIREFLDSTGDGQVFTFDPYGTESRESAWAANVKRDDEGYTETRVVPVGRGGEDDFIQFFFRVRSA